MNCNATNEEFQGMDILVTQEDQFNNDNITKNIGQPNVLVEKI